MAGKRSVKRLGKVAGGILLVLGSVAGVPAIGQMIGTDDDKPVIVVIQQGSSGRARVISRCRRADLEDRCRSPGQIGSREPIWCLPPRGGQWACWPGDRPTPLTRNTRANSGMQIATQRR